MLGNAKKRTHLVRRSLNPEFHQVLEFDSLVLRGVLQTQLLFRVYDKDGLLSWNDSLGDVSVLLDLLREQDEADFAEQLSTQGSLQFSVEWVSETARARVIGRRMPVGRDYRALQVAWLVMALEGAFERAVGLVTADANGRSDPYVMFSMGGTQKRSRVHETLDPEFNETLEFGGLLHQLALRDVVESRCCSRCMTRTAFWRSTRLVGLT